MPPSGPGGQRRMCRATPAVYNVFLGGHVREHPGSHLNALRAVLTNHHDPSR